MVYEGNKRLCVRSSGDKGSFSDEAVNGKARVIELEWIPREDLKDLFRYCDLKTRCKLRRVSQYWKCLVSLGSVNEVVSVDTTCLLATGKPVRNNTSGGHPSPELVDRYLQRLQGAKCVNWEHFRRHGLMGSHVRAIIYDGQGVDVAKVDTHLAMCLRIIGMHCTGLQHIIFHRMEGYIIEERSWMLKKTWSGGDFAGRSINFPELSSITFMSSRFSVPMDMEILRDREAWLWVSVPLLLIEWNTTDPNEVAPASFDPFLWPHPQSQRDWVAKWAPTLPEIYQNMFAIDGSSALSDLDFTATGVRRQEKYDLRTVDYNSLRPCVLRVLAWYLLHGKEVRSAPPASPFPFLDEDDT